MTSDLMTDCRCVCEMVDLTVTSGISSTPGLIPQDDSSHKEVSRRLEEYAVPRFLLRQSQCDVGRKTTPKPMTAQQVQLMSGCSNHSLSRKTQTENPESILSYFQVSVDG